MNPDTGWDLVILGGAGAVVGVPIANAIRNTSTRDKCGSTSATRAGADESEIVPNVAESSDATGPRAFHLRGGSA